MKLATKAPPPWIAVDWPMPPTVTLTDPGGTSVPAESTPPTCVTSAPWMMVGKLRLLKLGVALLMTIAAVPVWSA
jgi:hypothetical protein